MISYDRKYKITIIYINFVHVLTFVFVMETTIFDSMQKIHFKFLRKVKMESFTCIVKMINAIWTGFYDTMSSVYCLFSKEKTCT